MGAIICILLLMKIIRAFGNIEDSESLTKERPSASLRDLYEEIFTHYHSEVRPIYNDNASVEVTMRFWLKQIQKVDETNQILRVYCWLEEYWTDEFLVWDPAENNGVELLHVPTTKLWKPDILVYNSANMNTKDNEMETNALVRYNGSIILFRSMITDITCNLDLTYFPFDQQVCYIMLASWSFDGSKLMLELADKLDYDAYYIPNNEWRLNQMLARRNKRFYDCCPHPFVDVSYYFVLERSPSYYIFSLVIPSGFITVVTIIGFFTPYSTTGENTEKVSLGVTALLSMAIIMMMISDEMPATSQVMPLIGKYYIGLIFIIFGAAFTTTVTLALQMRGNAGRPMPVWARRFFFGVLPRCYIFSWLLHADQFDPVPRMPEEPITKQQLLEEREYVFNAAGAGVCTGEANRQNLISTEYTSVSVNQSPLSDSRKHCSMPLFNHVDKTCKEQQPPLVAETVSSFRKDSATLRLSPSVARGGGGGTRVLLKDVECDEPTSNGRTRAAPATDMTPQSPPVLPSLHCRDDEDPATRSTSTQPQLPTAPVSTQRQRQCIEQILTTLTGIDAQLREKRRAELVVREWQQLARILERVLMLTFVVITALFVTVIFSNQGPRLVLTEDVMDKLQG